MKLRIHHQEIRFRLSPKDIDVLETQTCLNETLTLSTEVTWTFTLNVQGDVPQIHASPNGLSVSLPKTSFTNWLRGPEIEWFYEQERPKLALLIEKDLKPHRT